MKTQLLLITLAAITGLTACGPMNQDPLKDHPLVANSRPVENPNDIRRVEPEVREVIVVQEKPVDRPVYIPTEPDQNYAAAQLFQINNLQSLSFVAGHENTVTFDVKMLQGQIDFSASLIEMGDAKFDEIASDSNKKSYRLTYTPPVDSLVGTSREKTGNMKIQLNIKSIKADTDAKQKRIAQAFEAVSKVKPFEYIVRRDYSAPKLEVVDFPAALQEGEKKGFSVKVKANGTYKGFQPELIVGYDYKGLTGGLFENNGSPFIRPSSSKPRIEDLGNGEWMFNFDLDTTLFAIPAQLDNNLKIVTGSDSLALRATLRVISPVGSTSDEKVIQYKINYKKVSIVTSPMPLSTGTVAPSGSTTQ